MTAQNNSGGPDLLTQVHIAVIRLDAKVDQVREQQKSQRDEHLDHEARIRILESSTVSKDKIQALEDRPYVSPATVWRVVGLICTIATIALTVVGLTLR